MMCGTSAPSAYTSRVRVTCRVSMTVPVKFSGAKDTWMPQLEPVGTATHWCATATSGGATTDVMPTLLAALLTSFTVVGAEVVATVCGGNWIEELVGTGAAFCWRPALALGKSAAWAAPSPSESIAAARSRLRSVMACRSFECGYGGRVYLAGDRARGARHVTHALELRQQLLRGFLR